eukprot:2023-Pleurochrysis_carterae.AAC.1
MRASHAADAAGWAAVPDAASLWLASEDAKALARKQAAERNAWAHSLAGLVQQEEASFHSVSMYALLVAAAAVLALGALMARRRRGSGFVGSDDATSRGLFGFGLNARSQYVSAATRAAAAEMELQDAVEAGEVADFAPKGEGDHVRNMAGASVDDGEAVARGKAVKSANASICASALGKSSKKGIATAEKQALLQPSGGRPTGSACADADEAASAHHADANAAGERNARRVGGTR